MHPLQPREPGLLAHCGRVSALVSELGNAAGLSRETILALEESALLHHYEIRLADVRVSGRLLADVMGLPPVAEPPAIAQPPIPETVRAILEVFHSVAPASEETRLLADILDFANVFDEQLEAAPLVGEDAEETLEEFLDSATNGLWRPEVMEAFQKLPRASIESLMEVPHRLPPFASEGLWQHSLRVAAFTRRLAETSGRFDPSAAFLAGLVHDVGTLALNGLTGEAAALRARLEAKACAPVWIETIVCGCDHGAIGGRLLAGWNFPADIVHAVRYHHCPEQSQGVSRALASLLYLAEFWDGSDEDLPSCIRMKGALDEAGLSAGALEDALREKKPDVC